MWQHSRREHEQTLGAKKESGVLEQPGGSGWKSVEWTGIQELCTQIEHIMLALVCCDVGYTVDSITNNQMKVNANEKLQRANPGEGV